MSKTFARSSLCALSMTIMTAHAAEPPTNLDKPEGLNCAPDLGQLMQPDSIDIVPG